MASYLRMRDRANKQNQQKKKSKDYSFNFDIDKMKQAIDSPSITIPEGLTRDEFIDFLKKHSVS